MDTNNIIVLGAGESGVGAAVLARKKGFDVFVSDNNKIKGKYKNVLSQFDIEFEEGDAFIYCQDDPVIMERIKKGRISPRKIPFTLSSKVDGEGAYIKDNNIIINIQSNIHQMTLESLALQGKHNIYNSMAAGISGRLLDITKQHIQDSLTDFQHIEHRLEHIAVIQGIEFINDSKATNVNAVWYALENMQNDVIWIAGGIDKGNDYSILLDLVKDRVKAIVCLGKDNKHLQEAFSGTVETIIETRSMDVAVQTALYLGGKGDTILLSPACASFDLFENFEDRGNQFKESVNKL